jgi:hypothetical protein
MPLVWSQLLWFLLFNPDLPTRALGSLQGVNLHHFLGSSLYVGGEIAGAIFPLGFWIGAGLAVDALL